MNVLFENNRGISRPHRKGVPQNRLNPRRWPISFFIVVLLPTFISSIYFGFIATPRYVSEAVLVIEADNDASAAGALAVMLSSIGGLGTGAAAGQAYLVGEYVKSAAILDQLQTTLNLRDIYSRPEVDYFSRLKAGATKEEFLEYYRSAIEIELDTTSRILRVRAEAFTPDEAKLIVQTVLILSEDLLNKILLRKQSDMVAFAKREVVLAETRLTAARLQLSEFRRENIDIDPARSAEAQGGLIANLTAQLAETRMEMTSSLAFLKPESVQAKAFRARINALEVQIIEEQKRLVSGNDGTINARLARYEEVLFEQEFARSAYTSALTFLETSRLTSQKQRNYVVDFVDPNLPEESLRPERIKIVLTTLAVCFLIWGIGTLLAGALRENARP